MYANVNGTIIYFDNGRWKVSLANLEDNRTTVKDADTCFSVDSTEDAPPAGTWNAHNSALSCLVQKGKAGADWCPCNDPRDPSAQSAMLLLAELGDLILWDARTVHGGGIGPGVLPPPPDGAVGLSRLSVAVNMTPRRWATEEAMRSRRDALRDRINLTMYPHEPGAADGTVRDVRLADGRSQPVRWARRAVLTKSQAALVPVEHTTITSWAMDRQQTIVLVRHGQGFHNVAHDYSILDPELTELGHQQAAGLRGHAAFATAELVVVSPLARAIQTARDIWGACPDVPMIITALHTERANEACDVGTAKPQLAEKFPFVTSWDGWSELPDEWMLTVEADRQWKQKRVPAFVEWLRAREETYIVVVGHGEFFSHLIKRLGSRHRCHMQNCEVKTFVI